MCVSCCECIAHVHSPLLWSLAAYVILCSMCSDVCILPYSRVFKKPWRRTVPNNELSHRAADVFAECLWECTEIKTNTEMATRFRQVKVCYITLLVVFAMPSITVTLHRSLRITFWCVTPALFVLRTLTITPIMLLVKKK